MTRIFNPLGDACFQKHNGALLWKIGVYLYSLTKLKKIKLFYFHCSGEILLSNQVRRILKGFKNTMPDKSGNPESLKKQSQQFETFLTNVPQTMCSEGFTTKLRDFYMKIIVAIIPTDLVTNSLLFSFCPFLQTRKKIRFSASWFSGNKNISLFFVYSELRLTSNPCRIQQTFIKDFFTCYPCWYDSSMVFVISLFKSVKIL